MPVSGPIRNPLCNISGPATDTTLQIPCCVLGAGGGGGGVSVLASYVYTYNSVFTVYTRVLPVSTFLRYLGCCSIGVYDFATC